MGAPSAAGASWLRHAGVLLAAVWTAALSAPAPAAAPGQEAAPTATAATVPARGADGNVVALYRRPPQVLAELADAPSTPRVIVDPSRRWLLVLPIQALPPIGELAQREVRLAGLRINPQTDATSRQRYYTGMTFVRLADGSQREVSGLPAEARIGGVSWSPDGTRVAFTQSRRDGTELWIAELASGRALRLGDARLSLILNESPRWLADGKSLLCSLVPMGRGEEPAAPQVPAGPVLQETTGRAAPARTYQDLLKTAYDETLLEHYLTVQLARVDLEGKVIRLGPPGMHRAMPSPDGRYLLVETFHRPFSYLVPLERFPRQVEVWDAAGSPVRRIADLPLQESVPITFDSVPAGAREMQWRDDAAATLVWVEALDDGDAGKAMELRDRVELLPAPFSGSPRRLADLAYRFAGVDWASDGLALIYEAWWKARRTRTWIVRRAGADQAAPEVLFDRSFEDRYGDPGEPLKRTNAYGRRVLLTSNSGTTLYFIGVGASPEGDRPFLDALDLSPGSSGSPGSTGPPGPPGSPGPQRQPRRLFRSRAPAFEQPLALVGDGDREILVRRESVNAPPNYFVREADGKSLRQVTFFPHPSPQLAGIQKELIRYQRDDGVKLTATLYLPAGYQVVQGPLPLLMWAYPQEFKSADAAGQVTTSPYRFDQVAWYSPMIWLSRGYAVLDNPGMPIVGAGEKEPNDSYIPQLVADAKAAVDEMVRRGVAERGRIAIAGHSYGAFMTANLLAHTRFFAAGIALSGAYNRTLTPFGFQSEQRTLWQAPAVYAEMSPFMHADEVAAPLLIVHGQADNNSGTDPVQSERFYNALKGLGATARLVLLPLESHGYQGRESVLHLLWEMDRWLDTYLKHPPAAPAAASPTTARPAPGARRGEWGPPLDRQYFCSYANLREVKPTAMR